MTSTWTRFMDMSSGGSTKHTHEYILIEAPQAEAEVIFYNRYGSNPYRVTCPCCGEDYSVSDGSLTHVTGYDRNLRSVEQKLVDGLWQPLPEGVPYYLEPGDPEPEGFTIRYESQREQTLEEYEARKDVLFIRADEITDDERKGELPAQGYIWQD